jgi:mortality factor 4-like protein 1
MKKYEVGELVMAADSGKLYEAKIIKIQEIDEVCKYFIHYNGWARKYDTWIDDDLIAKKGETKAVEKLREHAKAVWVPEAKKSKGGSIKIGKNKQVVAQIEQARSSKTETESKPTESSSSSTQKASSQVSEEVQLDRKKIRRALLMIEIAEQEDCLFSSRIEIPFSLKTHLVDEWSLVSKEPRRLLKLPKDSSVTVRGIVEDFIDVKLHKLGDSDPVVSPIDVFMRKFSSHNNLSLHYRLMSIKNY